MEIKNIKNKSYFHQGGEIPLLGRTIPQHFLKVVEQFPDREAVVSLPQNRRISYRQFSEQTDQLAKGLLALDFKPGDRIGILSTNNIEWLLLQMATARIGVILVNINPANRLTELKYALERSEVQGLFVIPEFRSSHYVNILIELMPELNQGENQGIEKNLKTQALEKLRCIVLYDPANPVETKRPAPGFTLWAEVIDAGKSVSTEILDSVTNDLEIDDPINIQYTSGTTGFPKPVVLTHHNILNNAYFAALAMEFTEQDRLVVPVPFYHCFGMVLANLLCFSVGACNVIGSEHFDPLAVLKAVDQEKCTAIHGVPTMFIAELDHPQFKDFDLSSLRTGIMAGAPCPPELMTRVIEEMHCKDILIGYGETEASPLTHLTLADDSFERRIHTVGRNLSHQEVKIVDTESGKTVDLGEVGEVCFRGYHIMKEYYQSPEATEKTIDENGWLFSGDLGTMDAEGYVKITGRLKEMIIRGGENIYPAEIEDVIFNHPKVQQVAVFGVPDDFFGEEIMGWVLPNPDKTISEEEIRTYCKDKLAHFKIPKYLWIVDSFPMTVTGKLQKFKMREIALEKMKEMTA